jgi:hypothetical protein
MKEAVVVKKGEQAVSESGLAIDGHGALFEESPYRIPSRKFTMWLFIISDAVTFGAFLFAYGYLRVASPNWTRPFESGSVINVILMTVVLITSSLTMLGAVDSSKAGDKPKALRFLYSTMALGALFALLHLREWFELFRRGITLSSGLFGQTFFTITAFTCFTSSVALSRSSSSLSSILVTGLLRATSKPRACTGTSSIWSGCSLCRSFISRILPVDLRRRDHERRFGFWQRDPQISSRLFRSHRYLSRGSLSGFPQLLDRIAGGDAASVGALERFSRPDVLHASRRGAPRLVSDADSGDYFRAPDDEHDLVRQRPPVAHAPSVAVACPLRVWRLDTARVRRSVQEEPLEGAKHK